VTGILKAAGFYLLLFDGVISENSSACCLVFDSSLLY